MEAVKRIHLGQNGPLVSKLGLGCMRMSSVWGSQAPDEQESIATIHEALDSGITKEMVNAYWETRPYTLEIPPILGNCDLCFLKGKNNIIKIMALYPELAEKWIEDERRANSGRIGRRSTFFPDTTYEELFHIARQQKHLFDLADAVPAYSCSCTN